MKTKLILHTVADKVWPIFLPIALVGAVWFVWKAARESKARV